jgi:hypothetical protein
MCTWKPLEGLEAINLFGLELLEAQMHITVLDSKRKPLFKLSKLYLLCMKDMAEKNVELRFKK